MGQRGRAMVEQSFIWPAIAKQMLVLYRWMLGTAERPALVS